MLIDTIDTLKHYSNEASYTEDLEILKVLPSMEELHKMISDKLIKRKELCVYTLVIEMY
jgi:hypothetical protein